MLGGREQRNVSSPLGNKRVALKRACEKGRKEGRLGGEDTSLSDGHARQEFVQLLVVADGQLQVTGDDPRLLVVPGSVSCQLQHLGGQLCCV
ncbi:hypothetical protein ACOMHN_020394 [Nucella lapillus]